MIVFPFLKKKKKRRNREEEQRRKERREREREKYHIVPSLQAQLPFRKKTGSSLPCFVANPKRNLAVEFLEFFDFVNFSNIFGQRTNCRIASHPYLLLRLINITIDFKLAHPISISPFSYFDTLCTIGFQHGSNHNNY